jgi:hypothetical protein
MKMIKKVCLVIISVILVSSIVMGCSSGQSQTISPAVGAPTTAKTATTPAPNTTMKTTASATTAKTTAPVTSAVASTPAKASDPFWSNIPIYPGANTFQFNVRRPDPADAAYSKVEWQYYKTPDSSDKVGAYYRQQMAAKGWKEAMWIDDPGSGAANGTFTDSKQNMLEVWISTDQDKTTFLTLGIRIK